MFGRFKKEETETNQNFIELNIEEPIDCLCDFTYNFYWNHKGEKLNPKEKIPNNNYSFQYIVDHLKKGNPIKINGDVGHRLCSSMGVDLAYFGGTGSAITVGDVFVNGNVDSRMGISIRKGSIYVSGKIKEPIGNLVEVKSDIKRYRKFISVTELLMDNPINIKLIDAKIYGKKLEINDGLIRDTLGARLNKDFEIILKGDADLSTGILMKKGIVRVDGNSGNNTAALLNGGTVIINGNCNDFTAVEMKKGIVIVNGDAGKFLAPKKISGKIYSKNGSPIFPVKKQKLDNEDKEILQEYKFNSKGFFKFE